MYIPTLEEYKIHKDRWAYSMSTDTICGADLEIIYNRFGEIPYQVLDQWDFLPFEFSFNLYIYVMRNYQVDGTFGNDHGMTYVTPSDTEISKIDPELVTKGILRELYDNDRTLLMKLMGLLGRSIWQGDRQIGGSDYPELQFIVADALMSGVNLPENTLRQFMTHMAHTYGAGFSDPVIAAQYLTQTMDKNLFLFCVTGNVSTMRVSISYDISEDDVYDWLTTAITQEYEVSYLLSMGKRCNHQAMVDFMNDHISMFNESQIREMIGETFELITDRQPNLFPYLGHIQEGHKLHYAQHFKLYNAIGKYHHLEHGLTIHTSQRASDEIRSLQRPHNSRRTIFIRYKNLIRCDLGELFRLEPTITDDYEPQIEHILDGQLTITNEMCVYGLNFTSHILHDKLDLPRGVLWFARWLNQNEYMGNMIPYSLIIDRTSKMIPSELTDLWSMLNEGARFVLIRMAIFSTGPNVVLEEYREHVFGTLISEEGVFDEICKYRSPSELAWATALL